jgi:hypothetical protein
MILFHERDGSQAFIKQLAKTLGVVTEATSGQLFFS